MTDATGRSGDYFAREPAPEGARGSGAWYDVGELEPVEFVRGLLIRPVVGDGVMVTFVSYEPRTVVPEHSHAEEQIAFVLEGEFEFEIAGETRLLRPGMVAHVPAHVPHAARTLDSPCVQVDVFAPPRAALLDALGRGDDAPPT